MGLLCLFVVLKNSKIRRERGMDNGRGKKWLVALLAVITVAAVGACLYLVMNRDKTPPVISIADDGFIYNQSMSRTDLLAGVTAQDDRDGDVTDQIVVEQVTVSEDGATASITYAVTDNSKNVAKKVREVPCSDEVTQQTAEESVQEEQETETTTETTDNTEADVQDEETEPQTNPEAPVITLTDEEITVEKNSSFAVLKYVKKITDDKDTQKRLYNNIEVKGHVDISTSGEYDLIYFVTDSDGNRSNEAELKVTVQ